jgi:hypothetical protein
MMNISGSGTFTWNGPICGQCGAPYVNHHACSHEDILRRVRELLAIIDGQATSDRTGGCPCRPENGGSGVCGCVLSGPQITC